MTITSILDPGTAAADSLQVAVAKGDIATLGIYSAADAVLGIGQFFRVFAVTAGAANFVCDLSNTNRAVQVPGPGTYFVRRQALSGSSFGVYKDI